MTVSIRHVDTCLSCYVLDHCNGERETLLGVPVNNGTTYEDVFLAVAAEWNEADLFGREDVPGAEAFMEALLELFTPVTKLNTLWEPSLEVSGEDDCETCFSWFRVSWEAE